MLTNVLLLSSSDIFVSLLLKVVLLLADDRSKRLIDFEQGLHAPFRPRIATEAWVAPNAVVSGRAEIWKKANLWYGVVVRADHNLIRIGFETNIQDNTIILVRHPSSR